MANTTFSGPIRAGNIRNTTGTTVGTDIANVGYVVMSQTFTTGTTLASGASAANVTDVVIPANSQIIDMVIDCPTVMAGATAVLSVGDTVGGNATYINAYSITVASGVGRKYPTTQSGGALSWADTGSADERLTWTTTGATSAGEIRVTVLYAQALNTTIQP